MLYIYVEKPTYEGYEYVQANYVTRVSPYFDNVYEDEWFSDDFTKETVKEIDKSDVIDSRSVYNEYGGSLPVTDLSTGVKSLMLLKFTDKKICGDRLGDNCVSRLLEIANNKDIHISLDHIMPFPDYFEAIIENTGVRISTFQEFIDEYLRSREVDEVEQFNYTI